MEKHPAFGPRTFYRTRSSPGRSSRSTTSTTTNSSFLRPEVHQSLPRRPSKRPRKRSTGRRTSSARAGSRQRQRRRRRSGVSAGRRRRARTITCARSSRPAWASSPCPSSRHSFSMGGIRWTSAFSCTAGTSSPPSLKYSRPSSSGRCSAASRHRVGPLCSCSFISSPRACGRSRARRCGNTPGCTWRWPRRCGSCCVKRLSRCRAISPQGWCSVSVPWCGRPRVWWRSAFTDSGRLG